MNLERKKINQKVLINKFKSQYYKCYTLIVIIQIRFKMVKAI